MIPTAEQLAAIARQAEGDLAQIPFAVLVRALAAAGRTAEVDIVRAPLTKTIIFESGVPVDCRSNLLHETFGRFLVARGSLNGAEAKELAAESARTGVRVGELLIRSERMRPSEVFRALQENLAKKLLDGFTWRQGTFAIRPCETATESPLKVKVPQLVVTGIVKLARQDEIDQGLADLVGKRLALHPNPPYTLSNLRMSDAQRAVARSFLAGKALAELAAETRLPFAESARLTYALAVLGIVVPEDRIAEAEATRVIGPDTKPISRASQVLTAPRTGDELQRVRDDLHAAYLRYRTQDSFELLGLEETTDMVEIENGYLTFCQRFAPWRFIGEMAPLNEKAEELFLAGGRAFGELCNVESRNALLMRRKQLKTGGRKRPATDRFAIRSELLDPAVQFEKGAELLAAGRFGEALELLAFSHDLDPQNSRYRSELAYCRYRHDPYAGDEALKELEDTVRIDPKFGLARYYSGVIRGERGDLEGAEIELRTASKLMKPDRRPIEALKALVPRKT